MRARALIPPPPPPPPLNHSHQRVWPYSSLLSHTFSLALSLYSRERAGDGGKNSDGDFREGLANGVWEEERREYLEKRRLCSGELWHFAPFRGEIGGGGGGHTSCREAGWCVCLPLVSCLLATCRPLLCCIFLPVGEWGREGVCVCDVC